MVYDVILCFLYYVYIHKDMYVCIYASIIMCLHSDLDHVHMLYEWCVFISISVWRYFAVQTVIQFKSKIGVVNFLKKLN